MLFDTGELLLTGAWLELTTMAAFDAPAEFAVELFAVVLVAPAQAEKSRANEAMLRIGEVLTLMS